MNRRAAYWHKNRALRDAFPGATVAQVASAMRDLDREVVDAALDGIEAAKGIVARHMGMDQGTKPLVYSTEETANQIVQAILPTKATTEEERKRIQDKFVLLIIRCGSVGEARELFAGAVKQIIQVRG